MSRKERDRDGKRLDELLTRMHQKFPSYGNVAGAGTDLVSLVHPREEEEERRRQLQEAKYRQNDRILVGTLKCLLLRYLAVSNQKLAL
jgi:hypothetical protein